MIKTLHVGLDVGSTTVKIIVMDENLNTIYTDYKRHFSDTKNTICNVLENLIIMYPDTEFTIALTGSGAISAAKFLDLPFIQEVVSCKRAVEKYIPETDVVIELGGEDAKIIYFDKFIEQRMNGTCAGGTGAFIDQMASLLNTDPTGLNELAKSHKLIYPIASRCGVFAKTDIQPLLNEGAAKEDIAASIFQAVVNQTISGLACGRPIRGNVAFLGGPLNYLSELRNRFIETLNLKDNEIIVPNEAHLLVAKGAALDSLNSHTITIEKLKSKIRDQISYLEKDLISMLNGFNNISYSNYKIEKKQGAQSSQTNTLIEENKKQGSTNGESSQETKRNNDSVEKSSNESESDNMNDNNSNASNQGNSSIIMVPNSILLSDINQKIDWNNMKYEIEKIYSTWNSLFIDLNSLEKGNTKTLEFSSTLNDTTKSIKAENKIASMQNIAEMYIKLGDYSKSYTNDNLQINIIDTKKNIIQAYVYVTENNWDMALNSINKADESFGNVINNVSAQPANQSNINKAYVLLKEEKKAIDLKDQDIFFINYKMIMQELYDI